MQFRWIVLPIFLLMAMGYAFLVEPRWLEVTHQEFFAPVLTPIKIAHLTDLHLREIGPLERTILKTLEREKPDLIAITGDNVSNDSTSYGVAHEFLNHLHAPLGVFGVNGNWEHWTSEEQPVRAYASLSNVTELINANRQARPDLWIVGLDDALAGKPNPEAAFAGVPKGAMCVMLFHSPAYFSEIAGKCALALSGHTHGGQIRLPFLGPLWLPSGSGDYVSGWYEKGRSKMYVSRGIGNSIINARFLSRPELAFITIRGVQ